MASWLTHLRIAEKIKQKVKDIDIGYLMIGSIAPNSGIPDESGRNYEPSQEITHFRYIKEGLTNYNIDEYYNKYMTPEKFIIRSDKTRSFLWGYYFHLIGDSVWLDEYMKPFIDRYEKMSMEQKPEFEVFLRQEADALDFEYLKASGTGIIDELKNYDFNIHFFDEFDASYIYECKKRVVDFYTGEPIVLNRDYIFLSSDMIDSYVNKISERCIKLLL
ncbi:MAG: hypothetical protein ACOZCL_11805 [Bacillota bacterium]